MFLTLALNSSIEVCVALRRREGTSRLKTPWLCWDAGLQVSVQIEMVEPVVSWVFWPALNLGQLCQCKQGLVCGH